MRTACERLNYALSLFVGQLANLEHRVVHGARIETGLEALTEIQRWLDTTIERIASVSTRRTKAG
jgi:hypothetical protein